MILTIISNRIKGIKISKLIGVFFIFDVDVILPNRNIRICPEIMFAVNRRMRVNGRASHLIVSITTINGIRSIGVEGGVK